MPIGACTCSKHGLNISLATTFQWLLVNVSIKFKILTTEKSPCHRGIRSLSYPIFPSFPPPLSSLMWFHPDFSHAVSSACNANLRNWTLDSSSSCSTKHTGPHSTTNPQKIQNPARKMHFAKRKILTKKVIRFYNKVSEYLLNYKALV